MARATGASSPALLKSHDLILAGYGRNISAFDAKVENGVELLREALWMYLEAASDSSSEWNFWHWQHDTYPGIRSRRICANVHTDWCFSSCAGGFLAN